MTDYSTRQRIIAETQRLLNQPDKTNGITMGQVASAAHVSRATLYRYFPDKATLLRAAGVANEELPGLVTARVRILDAMLELASERGIHAATLEEIANRAGLSRSGLHWHYKTKDDLIADLAQNMPVATTVQTEAARAGAADADLETQLTHLVDVILREMDKYREIARFAIFEAAVYPDVAQYASKHTIGRILPLLVRLFEQYERKGLLRPGTSQARAQAFMGMFLLLILLRPAFSDLLAPDDKATAREYIDIFLHGILADPKGE